MLSQVEQLQLPRKHGDGWVTEEETDPKYQDQEDMKGQQKYTLGQESPWKLKVLQLQHVQS